MDLKCESASRRFQQGEGRENLKTRFVASSVAYVHHDLAHPPIRLVVGRGAGVHDLQLVQGLGHAVGRGRHQPLTGKVYSVSVIHFCYTVSILGDWS